MAAVGADIPFGWSVRSRNPIDDRFITANLTSRDALSTFRRHKNLEVFVESENKSFYLDNSTTNSDWKEVLKNIDVLTESSLITDNDYVVWFDDTTKTHLKIKLLDFKTFIGSGGGGDTVEGNEDRGIEVTEPTPGTKLVAKKYKNTFITVGASVAITLSEGRRHILSVANDFDLLNPTNIGDYEGPVEIIITQGLGGDHQINTVGDKIIFPNNVIPTLSGVFGESDWLRGIAANGYLLIYQIENLAAPGIEVEPPPPPPIPVSNYLFLFSFFEISSTITKAGEYQRNEDSNVNDLLFSQGRVNTNALYTHLKASSPISSFGAFGSSSQVWLDQSGNGRNLTPAGGTQLFSIGFTKNKGIGFVLKNGTRMDTAINFPSVTNVTYTFVVRGKNTTSNQALCNLGSIANNYFSLGADSNGNIRLSIRRTLSDSFLTITTSSLLINDLIIQIVINYSTGAVSLLKNNTVIGSGTLTSTGSSVAAPFRIFEGGDNNNVNIYYISAISTVNNTDVLNEFNYVNNLYNSLLSSSLKNGELIDELFDLIINLDRYNYSPYAANVRESGGNTELVISHDNTTGLFDVTAFNTHIGANQGFASRIINQKTPTQALAQTTAARQLRIIPDHFGTNRAAFLGDNAARRSIQGTFAINTKALHYYWFMAVEIISTPTNPYFFSITASGNVIMSCLYFESGGKPRLRTVTRRLTSDTARTTSSSTDLEYATKYLVSCHFDYQNGIINVWANGTQVINDTGGFSGTSVAAASLLTIGNFADNNANGGVNAYLTAPFLVQGLISSAQREAIEAYLMDNYGI